MPKRGPRFTQEERLAIVKEGEKDGINAVCAKYALDLFTASSLPPRNFLVLSHPDSPAQRPANE
jgi:hypothetical protein